MNGTRKSRNVLVATRRKRKDDKEDDNDPPSEVVNDLEIAHKYASVSSCFSALDLGKTASSTDDFRFAKEDKNSTPFISPRIVDYSSSSEEGDEGPNSVSGSTIGSSESSEYESDIEWTEALARMDPDEIIDEDEQIDGWSSLVRNDAKDRQHAKPKSNCGNKSYYYHNYLNQIDGSQLQPGEQQQAQFSPKKDDVIELVGNVKSHIIDERVIVVESLSYGGRNKPLGEGNVLLLSKNDVVDVDTADGYTCSNAFFPLGAICEVFGPVSRPLYTVQLPSPVSNTDPNGEKNNTGLMIQHIVERKILHDTNKGQEVTVTPSLQEREEDPWSETGLYTLKLSQRRQNNLIPVYFERKRAVWVDTHAIIEQSGRGCDVNEEDEKEIIEFSDDEAERQYYSSLTKHRVQKSQQKQLSLHQTDNANRNFTETKPQFMKSSGSSFNEKKDRRTTRNFFHSDPHTGSLGIFSSHHQHLQPYPQYQHATTEMKQPRLITHPTDSPITSTPDVRPITSATRKDFEADTVYYHY